MIIIPIHPAFGGLDIINVSVPVNKHAGVVGGFHQFVVFLLALSEFSAVCIVNELKLSRYNNKANVSASNIFLRCNLSLGI